MSLAENRSALRKLPGGGVNQKHVKDCKELYMGDMGLEWLEGFELLENLEILWINNNKLKQISNLDKNVRIKVLYAQDNCICSLEGSLPKFKFLRELDLSQNNLRDLSSVVEFIKGFHFLEHLNLQGNPCCKEPHYKSQMIHALSSIKILDHHVIREEERAAAIQEMGSVAVTLPIVFGNRAPIGGSRTKASTKHPFLSRLELNILKEAATIRRGHNTARVHKTEQTNIPICSQLPPPPGWRFGNLMHNNAGTLLTRSDPPSVPKKQSILEKKTGNISLEIVPYKKHLERRMAGHPWAVSRKTIVL